MNPLSKTQLLVIKRSLQVFFLCLAAVFLMKGMLALSTAQSTESSAQERKFETKDFKDMPLEVQVRNLQSGTWHDDLQIEVKNVSSKPIYFILAYLVFPDVKAPSGVSGIPLTYGKHENGLIEKGANPTDEHLDPGKTYVFTVPEVFRKGLAAKQKKFPSAMKKLELDFAVISFGDGTGFEAEQPTDFRGKQFKPPPPENDLSKKTN